VEHTTTLSEAFNPATEEGTPARELLPPGKYKAEVVKAYIAETKNGKGQMLNLQYSITEGEYEKRLVFDHIIVQHESVDAQRFGRQKVKDLCDATGVTDAVTDVEVFLYAGGSDHWHREGQDRAVPGQEQGYERQARDLLERQAPRQGRRHERQDSVLTATHRDFGSGGNSRARHEVGDGFHVL
jgi:Protein of unknown function (DUF669)